MAFDYSGLVGVSTDLIASFGRTVTLRKPSATPADNAKPWGAVQDDATASDDVLLEGVRNSQVQDLHLSGGLRLSSPFENRRSEATGQTVLLHRHHQTVAMPNGIQQGRVERFDETHVHHFGSQA